MPKSILVADDDTVILNLYKRIFTGTGHVISQATCFTEAAALINSNRYDLLITDMMFPDGVGTDLITIFERTQGCAKCILVSGSVTEIEPKQLPSLAGYFKKPINIDIFMAAVTKALA